MPDRTRLPDAYALLAEIDDDDAFRVWCDQLDEIAALPVRRWGRAPRPHNPTVPGAGWRRVFGLGRGHEGNARTSAP
jgi:hypothetical protein